MLKRLATYVLIMAIAMLFFLTGCSSKNDEEVKVDDSLSTPIEGGEVVMAIDHEMDSLDPHISSGAGTKEVLFNIYEGLMKPDSTGGVYPAIAKEYKISEDGLSYIFTLRENVIFHDGSTVTVEDVKFSLERVMGKFTENPLSSDLDKVSEINIVDDKNLEIVLKEVDSSLLSKLIIPIIPKSNEGNFTDNPIGTGPFMFEEYLPGQRVVIKKFDQYWNPELPHLDKVEFRIVGDIGAGLLSLRAGEIDMYPRLPNDKIEELGDEFKLVSGPQNLVQLMIMNNNVEPLNDVRVRKAINYAVDVDEIIEAVAYGYGSKLGSNMSPVMEKYYNKELENVYDVNIEKSKELLKEAGYEDGFEITVSIPSNYQFHVDTGQVICEQLKKVGIKCEIKLVEWGVWLEDIYTNRNYDMTIIGFSGKLDPHNILYRYYSDYSKNMMNYSNEEYDKLLDKALLEVDEDSRAQLYKEAQRILSDDGVCVFIMDPQFTVAMKKNITGYDMYPIYVQDMSTVQYLK